MANDSNIQDSLAAQDVLIAATQQYVAQLYIQLRDERDQIARDKINHQIAVITPASIKLQAGGLQIIGAKSTNDLANIIAVSNDVTKFVKGIKRIEAMVGVATSIVSFIAVCMTEKSDPVAIWKAGQKVYDAMNTVINDEAPKGSAAAINVKKLSLVFTSSLIGGKAIAVKKNLPSKWLVRRLRKSR